MMLALPSDTLENPSGTGLAEAVFTGRAPQVGGEGGEGGEAAARDDML